MFWFTITALISKIHCTPPAQQQTVQVDIEKHLAEPEESVRSRSFLRGALESQRGSPKERPGVQRTGGCIVTGTMGSLWPPPAAGAAALDVTHASWRRSRYFQGLVRHCCNVRQSRTPSRTRNSVKCQHTGMIHIFFRFSVTYTFFKVPCSPNTRP